MFNFSIVNKVTSKQFKEIFMSKKTLVSCFLSLVILSGGAVAYSSLSSAQEVARGENSQTSTTEVSLDKDNSHSKEKKEVEAKSSSEDKGPSSSTSETQQDSQIEQKHKAFVAQAVKQDFYLEKVDANGKLTYEKATDEKVKALMNNTSSDKGSIYQVVYNGKLISVLSTVN